MKIYQFNTWKKVSQKNVRKPKEMFIIWTLIRLNYNTYWTKWNYVNGVLCCVRENSILKLTTLRFSFAQYKFTRKPKRKNKLNRIFYRKKNRQILWQKYFQYSRGKNNFCSFCRESCHVYFPIYQLAKWRENYRATATHIFFCMLFWHQYIEIGSINIKPY